MAEAGGVFESCGDGTFAFSYTCTGPDCDVLQDFPTVACTTSGNILNCTNGVTCPGASSYASHFTYRQQNDTIYYNRKVILPECEFSVSIDGDTAEPVVYDDTCGRFEDVSMARPRVARPARVWTLTVLAVFLGLFASTAVAAAREIRAPSQLQPRANTELIEKITRDWIEDKIKEFAKGDPAALSILIPGSDFLDDIEDTLCMEGLKLAFDELAEMSEANKKKIEKWAKPILKPFTSACSRKIRRLARKVKVKHPAIRLGAVFASGFVCEALKTAFVEEAIAIHPSNFEDDLKKAICGGDCGGADVMTDVENCGACNTKCEPGAICENGVCSSLSCGGLGQDTRQSCGSNDGCMCARAASADPAGVGFCAMADSSCAGQLTDDCTISADCQKGEICGFGAGCNVRTCLDVATCRSDPAPGVPSAVPVPEPGPEPSAPESEPPVPEPSVHVSEPVPEPSAPVSEPNPDPGVPVSEPIPEPSPNVSEPTPEPSIPVSSDPVPDSEPTPAPSDGQEVGWVLNVPYAGEDYFNYWVNDWADEKYFLTKNGKPTVQTRCVTVLETSEGSLLPGDGSKLPVGAEVDFDSTPDEGANSCCLEYYSDNGCSGGGGSRGSICGDGSVVLTFAVRSWKVSRCSGWWTGPPT